MSIYIAPVVEFFNETVDPDGGDDGSGASVNEKLDFWDMGDIKSGQTSDPLILRIWNNRHESIKNVEEYFELTEADVSGGDVTLTLASTPEDGTIKVYDVTDVEVSYTEDELPGGTDGFYTISDKDVVLTEQAFLDSEERDLTEGDKYMIVYDTADPEKNVNAASMNNVTLYPSEVSQVDVETFYSDEIDGETLPYSLEGIPRRSKDLVYNGWLSGRCISTDTEFMNLSKNTVPEGETVDDTASARDYYDVLDIAALEVVDNDGTLSLEPLQNERGENTIDGAANDGSGIDWGLYGSNAADAYITDIPEADYSTFDLQNFADVELKLKVEEDSDFGPTDFWTVVRYYYT